MVDELSLYRIAHNDIDNPDLIALADGVRRELTDGGAAALRWLATRPSADGVFIAVERGLLDIEWAQTTMEARHQKVSGLHPARRACTVPVRSLHRLCTVPAPSRDETLQELPGLTGNLSQQVRGRFGPSTGG